MTSDELKAWRDRLNLTNREAAARLELSLKGFLDQIYGHRSVSRRVATMAELVETKEKARPMKKTAIPLAIVLVIAATAAHAQGWDPGRAGGAPLPYNAPWSTPSSTYTPLYTPSPPSVPQVQSYVPAPSQGPSSYPCTLPIGCR